MPEKMVYVGHLDCCQWSNEILEKLVCVKAIASQIYRAQTPCAQTGKTTDPQYWVSPPAIDAGSLILIGLHYPFQ